MEMGKVNDFRSSRRPQNLRHNEQISPFFIVKPQTQRRPVDIPELEIADPRPPPPRNITCIDMTTDEFNAKSELAEEPISPPVVVLAGLKALQKSATRAAGRRPPPERRLPPGAREMGRDTEERFEAIDFDEGPQTRCVDMVEVPPLQSRLGAKTVSGWDVTGFHDNGSDLEDSTFITH
eukprot:TRINITY_DN12601_c0_g1_i1.p1 TRINITY_DN12601_c0_g1~~TRINITY_DN12601_c0_g1_i1.p1  ORF type:complete len:179 (+),score=32.91 TRINITY_DN12601_c0_g1_i1:13-549(+)